MNVSVIIPTYNRPNLLKKCVNALLGQDFTGTFEIIIVSDGEDAATENLIRQFRSDSIQYFQLDRHRGPAAARNKGTAEAKGELILFTDDDTIPQSNWISKFWQLYKRSRTRKIAFTGKVTVPVSKIPSDYELNIAGLETAEFVTANHYCPVNKSN